MKELVFRYHNQQIKENEKTLLCGILNVTPDSFSDGGKYFQRDVAIKKGLELIQAGANILDIGGESTRPGSVYVQIEEEIQRIAPVIKALKEQTDIPISVDTWKAEVAKAAIEAGADIVNDITGFLGDPAMAEVVGQTSAGAILMFNPVIARPEHTSSKAFPRFGGEGVYTDAELSANIERDVLELMMDFFDRGIQRAKTAGIENDRLMLDPGIGFGLTKRENLILIQQIDQIHRKGYLSFLGVSRKRFVQNILEENGFNTDIHSEEGFENRDLASSYLSAIAVLKRVSIVRVHQIPAHKMAVAMASSVAMAESEADLNFGAYQNK